MIKFCEIWLRNREEAKVVFLNRRAAARYRALSSIIPGRKNLLF